MRPWLWGTLHASGNLLVTTYACRLWAEGEFVLPIFLLLCSSGVLGLAVGSCEAAQQLCLRTQREAIQWMEASNREWQKIVRLAKGS